MKSIIRQLLLSFGIFLFAGLVLFAAPKNAAAMTETEYCRMFRYYAVLTDYQKEAYREVCSAIEKLQDEVIFSSAAMSIDEAGDVLTAISYDHPEYFWYGYEDINGQGSRYYNKERKVEKVMLNFNKYAFTGGDVKNGDLSLEVLNDNINLVETAADEILAGLSGKKDYEIEMYLHNQLAKDLSYNWEDYRFNLGGNVDGSDTSTNRLDLTIYNFLVQKKVICAGYARSFQYLMTRAGIPCYYAFGNARIVSTTTDEEGITSYSPVEGNHAWNVVLIQGEYYAIDITWDDLYGETDSNGTRLDFNRIDYSYFNLTKSNFGKGTPLAGYHENDSRCINVMPELCENDSYESFYNETREQSYVREMVDPDGAPRQANISSLSQFKTMATNFYKKHGEGYYWIPFMTLSEKVYSEINSYLRTNTNEFYQSLASAGGFTLKNARLRIYTYPLEMGMRHNYLIVRVTSTVSTDTLYTGIKQGHDENWYYYVESIFQSRYTGFQSNSNGRWRIENGKVNFNYSEVVYESGQWRYYSGGKRQASYNGTQTIGCTKYVFKNGVATLSYSHTAAAAVSENRIEPYCTAAGPVAGSYESVVYCSVCGQELSRETKSIPAPHTPAAPVSENRVEPYCTAAGYADGSYESVVYCSVCGHELSRETIVIPVTHTLASAVQENYTEPTCSAKGQYDSVVYCSLCKKEISRKTVVIPQKIATVEKIGSVWTYTVDGVPDYTFTGFAENSNGRFRVEKGVVNFSYTDIVNDGGQWRYYSGGKWQKTLASVEKRSNGTWWYIKNGVVQFGVEDIVKRSNGTWWYVKNGQVQFGVTSVEKRSNGTWWYVKGGQVQTKVTGLVKRTENNTWWYVKGGQVQFGATGVVKRADKNTWWYVKSGQLLTSFTGIAKRVDNSTKWYVQKGQVQTGYSGKITISGKKYTIKNGQVK